MAVLQRAIADRKAVAALVPAAARPAPDPAPVVQRVESAPAAAPVVEEPPPAAAMDRGPAMDADGVAAWDTDAFAALAARLYDPLMSRIRAELWQDRERAGRLADSW